MRFGEAHMGQHLSLTVIHQLGDLREVLVQLIGRGTSLSPRLGLAVLGEHRAQQGRHHSAPTLAGMRQSVAHEVCPAALSDRLPQPGSGRLEPFMGIGNRQSFTPRRPRRIRLRRKSVQYGSASEGPTRMLSTSSTPSAFTATAIIAATDTIRPASRTST